MGRNALWMLVCRVGADLLSLVLFVMISRELGPEGAGVYAYGFAIATLGFSATTLGIEDYGIREYSRRSRPDRALLVSDLLGSQLCVVAAAHAELAVYLELTAPTTATLNIVLSLTAYQLCAAISGTLFVPAMSSQAMVGPAVCTLLGRALPIVIACILIGVEHSSLELAMSVFPLGGALMIVLGARSARSFGALLLPHLSVTVLKDGARALWSFAMADVIRQLMMRIGVIVLSLRVSEAAAGIYAAGIKLAEAACLPVYFLGIAVFPRLCRAFANGAEFHGLARQALLIGTALAALIAATFFVAIPFILGPVLGPRFAGTEALIAAMGAIVFVQSVEMLLGRLLVAAHLSQARAAWVSLGGGVCVLVAIIVVPILAIKGAILAFALALLVVDFLYAASLRKTLSALRPPVPETASTAASDR
jgi:O-antigen/teichoic acid export membrane protein